MTTRFQADSHIATTPDIQCHPLDPSNHPEDSSTIRASGIACKAIFDCTVPFAQKDRFERAQFMEVVFSHWLSEMFREK